MLASTTLLLQFQEPAFRWIYVWLAAGALALCLAVLSFAYILVKRNWRWFDRLATHPRIRELARKLSSRFPRYSGFIRRRLSIREWRGLALTAAAAVVLVAVYLFAAITESWMAEEELYAFDQRTYGWLIEHMDPAVVEIMQIATHLGDTLTVVAISVAVSIYMIYRKRRWHIVELVAAVGFGSAFMWGLKFIFSRARPGDQLASAIGHSFPSGHSFMAAVLYGFLIYLAWRSADSDAVRIAVTVVLLPVILLVGLSRVILRVHWVSDVAGGITAGLGWLVASLIITQGIRLSRDSDTAPST